MSLKENDFLEIEFLAKVKDGEVFDTNIASELKKLNSKAPAKPFIFRLGKGMFLKGVEDFLIGKDVGKYELTLLPENAFGLRRQDLVRVVPMKLFQQQNLRPIPGFTFNFDGSIGKVMSASGGRVRVDFNNPVAGKIVEYNVEIKRKVTDEKEKIKAVIEFLLRKDFDFEIKDKNVTLKVPKGMGRVVDYFKQAFKDLSDYDLESLELVEKKKEDKKE